MVKFFCFDLGDGRTEMSMLLSGRDHHPAWTSILRVYGVLFRTFLSCHLHGVFGQLHVHFRLSIITSIPVCLVNQVPLSCHSFPGSARRKLNSLKNLKNNLVHLAQRNLERNTAVSKMR